MKRSIRQWLSLAIVPAAALAFLAASPASAADYSGDCAGVTAFNGTGNVSITDTSCTLPQSITATGSISITATSISGSGKNLTAGSSVTVTASGGDIDIGTVTSQLNTELSGESVTADDITSNWGVKVTATDGTLDLKEILSNANNSSFGGNVLLTATSNIKTEDIKNGGTTTTGGIEIHANTDGTTTAFNIGGGGSNGTGVLNVSNTTGGGSNPGYLPAGIYVVNGKSDSTGGITVDSMSSLVLTSSGGRAGILILDAKNGTLTLPTGTLNAGDSTAIGAGTIYLLADTVTTANGTVISASQSDSASGVYHYANISASTINVTGASGLEIKADGNGVTGVNATAFAALMPEGAISVSSTSTVNSLFWSVSTAAYTTDGSVTVSGSGKIKLTANGDYTRASVSGNGIIFDNNGDVVMEAKGGATSHEVVIAYSGDPAGTDVTFSNSGNVILDASAIDDGFGGEVNIFTHKFAMNKDSIVFRADGPSTGDGEGGKIYVSTSWDSGAGFQLNASATAVFSANATSDTNGVGDAQYSDPDVDSPKAITLWAGGVSLKLGTGSGQVSFSAKGGAGGGNGGAVVTTASNIQLMTANAVDVSALAEDSTGGSFQWYTYITSIDSGISNPVIKATGHGTGTGGKVKGYHSITDLDIDKYFAVGGGDSLFTATEADYGRLTFNGVACQARTTGFNDYPKYYWNCAHPDSASTGEVNMRNAISNLPTSFDNTLSNNDDVAIYVMTAYGNFNSFFNPATHIGDLNGVSDLPANRAVVFTRFGTNDSYLRAIVIHELAHHLDGRSSPKPSDDTNFITAISDVTDNMVGNYPTIPQSPTCMDVFDNTAFCTAHSGDIHPWFSYVDNFITHSGDTWEETFANSMQVCAGYIDPSPELDHALRSTYMREAYDWLDNHYWPGGCPGQP